MEDSLFDALIYSIHQAKNAIPAKNESLFLGVKGRLGVQHKGELRIFRFTVIVRGFFLCLWFNHMGTKKDVLSQRHSAARLSRIVKGIGFNTAVTIFCLRMIVSTISASREPSSTMC